MPDRPVRCGLPVNYEGNEYECSLHRGHPGECRTWVEEGDQEQDAASERAWDRELEQRGGSIL